MIETRRIFTQVEDIHHEFGPPAERPQRRGTIAAPGYLIIRTPLPQLTREGAACRPMLR
jgi:hypothetical protein